MLGTESPPERTCGTAPRSPRGSDGLVSRRAPPNLSHIHSGETLPTVTTIGQRRLFWSGAPANDRARKAQTLVPPPNYRAATTRCAKLEATRTFRLPSHRRSRYFSPLVQPAMNAARQPSKERRHARESSAPPRDHMPARAPHGRLVA